MDKQILYAETGAIIQCKIKYCKTSHKSQSLTFSLKKCSYIHSWRLNGNGMDYYNDKKGKKCIGRESNPRVAGEESTTEPPMLG